MIERLRLGWWRPGWTGSASGRGSSCSADVQAIMAVAAALRRNGGTLSGDAVNAMLPIGGPPEGRLCGRRNDPAQAID